MDFDPEIFMKAAFGVSVGLGGLSATIIGLLRGIKRDARYAAEAAAREKERDRAIARIEASLSRVWRVLEHGDSPYARPGQVLAYEDAKPPPPPPQEAS